MAMEYAKRGGTRRAKLAAGKLCGRVKLRHFVCQKRSRDLTIAGEYAAILSQLRWGSRWYPRQEKGRELPLPIQDVDRNITIPKLRHDLEQFEYLLRLGVLGAEFSDIIQEYEHCIERLKPRGADVRLPLEGEEAQRIGHVFNRMVHVRHTPRLRRVFSGKWNAAEVQREYLHGPVGLVVVDDFLTEEALAEVRQFCME